MIEEIKKELMRLAEPKNKEFNERIITTKLPILGIKIPTLRAMAKKINEKDFRLFLKEYDASSYELSLLKAYVIATAKMELEERFQYLDSFIPTIDNWAVHDGLVASLKCTKKHMEDMRKYILKYQYSEHEFEVRFIVVMFMTYYMDESYLEENLRVIQQLNTHAFYTKMGVAWYLATAMINYPMRIMKYLKELKDKEIKKMTIRKIRDSHRITKELKDEVLHL